MSVCIPSWIERVLPTVAARNADDAAENDSAVKLRRESMPAIVSRMVESVSRPPNKILLTTRIGLTRKWGSPVEILLADVLQHGRRRVHAVVAGGEPCANLR